MHFRNFEPPQRPSQPILGPHYAENSCLRREHPSHLLWFTLWVRKRSAQVLVKKKKQTSVFFSSPWRMLACKLNQTAKEQWRVRPHSQVWNTGWATVRWIIDVSPLLGGEVVRLMTKELNFTAPFSLALPRCRWTAWRVAVHECTRAKVHTYARPRARHPPVSVSVSSLTGNPALSNVPRGSQLERIRLEGWGLHGRVFGDLQFYFAWLFTEMNGPIETSNGLYSSMNMQVSSTWHCMTSWWFLFIFPTVIVDVWL